MRNLRELRRRVFAVEAALGRHLAIFYIAPRGDGEDRAAWNARKGKVRRKAEAESARGRAAYIIVIDRDEACDG